MEGGGPAFGWTSIAQLSIHFRMTPSFVCIAVHIMGSSIWAIINVFVIFSHARSRHEWTENVFVCLDMVI